MLNCYRLLFVCLRNLAILLAATLSGLSAISGNKRHAKKSTFLMLASPLLLVSLTSCSGHDTQNNNMQQDSNVADSAPGGLNDQLNSALSKNSFTGNIEQTLEQRLGRKVDPKLADLGRMLFFDRLVGLHNDNACAGCHAPATAFGDTQSIAIGIESNLIVGPDRTGPRNQRRTPSVMNTAFYPNLMWNGRFSMVSGDPFNNSAGFLFPQPEGTTKFPANDPVVTHLLIAQAHMPPTELNEAAGFTGVKIGVDPRLCQFDDGKGSIVPDPDASGSRNEPIRQVLVQRLNAAPEYVKRFGAVFPEVAAGAPIKMVMFARAIAEFEFSLVRATAPIDQFAMGNTDAMTREQKRGALLFFGKANCVTCHAVSGPSNEMFSDFKMHNIGVPQIAPAFGLGKGDTIFDGDGENEDFALEQFTSQTTDRYKFRSSPLRNVALQPAFFHNGAFIRLEDAIRHHLNVPQSTRNYDAKQAGVASDLTGRLAPVENVLGSLDPLIAFPTTPLTDQEFSDIVSFVRFGLTDERATPAQTCMLVPAAVPSGMPMLTFKNCPPN
jgi:cytochrome c peroxidase